MQAIVYSQYGPPDVLSLAEIPEPEPGPGEVLVRIRAVSLNLSDWETLRGKPLYARIGGLRRPKRPILGSDIAGEVAAVGPRTTGYTAGDRVYADILSTMGGFAEYVVVRQDLLARIPDGMTFEEAAAVPQAAAIALHGAGGAQPGQRVLINGGGGGAGSYAIQLAKLRGADVTAVDNAEKLDFMRSVGADRVLDYRQTDYTREGRTYDLILDLAAFRSVSAYRRSLTPTGRFLFVGGSMSSLFQTLLLGPFTGRKIRILPVKLGVRHLTPFVDLLRTGQLRTAVDRTFPLAETAEALRYLGGGHAKGKVVVTV